MTALLALGCAGRPARPPSEPPEEAPRERVFNLLRAGTYECEVTGMICQSCSRGITKAVSEVDGVEKAVVDLERGLLRLTVSDGRTIPMSAVERALAKAEARVNLGTSFRIQKIRYVP